MLTGISAQLSSLSNGISDVPPTLPGAFTASSSAIRINQLWFISLFLSLSVALAATLVQQWSRRYLHAAQRRGPPHKQGPVQVSLYSGMKVFRMERAVEVIIALLHAAVFLFLVGLVQFLFVVSPNVAHAFLPFICIGGVVYLVLSVLPGFSSTSPYDTPLAPLVRLPISFLFTFCTELGEYCSSRRVLPLHLKRTIGYSWENAYRSRKQALEQLCESPSFQMVQYALHLALKVLADQSEVEEFFAGLPDLFKQMDDHLFVVQDSRIAVHLVTREDIFERAKASVQSCRSHLSSHAHGLSTARKIRRVQNTLTAVQDMVVRIATQHARSPDARDTNAIIIVDRELGSLAFSAFWVYRDDDIALAVFATCAFVRLRLALLDSSYAQVTSGGDLARIGLQSFFGYIDPSRIRFLIDSYFHPARTLTGAHLANVMWCASVIWIKHRASSLSQESLITFQNTLSTLCESFRVAYDNRELDTWDVLITHDFFFFFESIIVR